MPVEIVTIYLARDRATNLRLLLLAGGYQRAPGPEASLTDRIEHETAKEILGQLERQDIR